MKIATAANCQGSALRAMLRYHYDVDCVDSLSEHFDWSELKTLDGFVYQPKSLQPAMLAELTCPIASFPRIYGAAFAPMYKDRRGIIGSEPIRAIQDAGWTVDGACKLFRTLNIPFRLKERHESCMAIIRAQVDVCNVHISDIIDAKIHTERIFTTQNHPTAALMYPIFDRIVHVLGLGPWEPPFMDVSFSAGSNAVTPYETVELGLEWVDMAHLDLWWGSYENLIKEIYAGNIVQPVR